MFEGFDYTAMIICLLLKLSNLLTFIWKVLNRFTVGFLNRIDIELFIGKTRYMYHTYWIVLKESVTT